MRLIFSRKGFDSQYGGVPSPIFPDGSILSLPIPSQGDARILSDMCHGDINIGDLAADLTGNRFSRNSHVHFDPDLHGPILERSPGWLPAFGQVAAAQSHLANQGVGEGDLFLFFGWFRRVEYYGGYWRYVPRTPNFHSIFGWLQVGEVVRVNERIKDLADNYPWLRSHPHVAAAASFESQNNTIYVGADSLRLGRTPLGINGGGVFREFVPRLRLTADGKTRSLWKLPAWFSPEGRLSSLSYHGKQSRWTQQGDSVLLQTVAKGQEFVLNSEHYPESESWIEDLFASFAQGHLETHL
jgi:hypothetical protein